MARAGVTFNNPLLPPAGDPSSPLAPPSLGGSLGGMGSTETALAGITALGESAVQGIRSRTAPPPAAGPSFGFNPATNQFFAKGRMFDAEDYQAAVESADTAGTAAPLPQGFQPLSEQQFGGYVQSIRNPGRGTLAARNLGRGIDQLQMLGGRGLQLIGAEETGQRIVDQQVEDLRRTQPYERQFTDIESGGDAVDWFVANLAQQGPMLLEAIGAGAAGFFAGGAVGGPLGAAGGALAGLAGRTAFKQAVLAAARKKAAGEALDQAESKILKSAAGLAGATAAATANSLQMGASDIYGELRDQGADAEDVGARLTALFGSIPYAAMDLLPEYALASRVFGTAVRSGAQVARRGDMLRRAGTGLATGAALEGSTEAGQEALLLGLSDQDFSDPKNIQRLINSFAAGAAIGGPIGAVANLKRGTPADVLGNGNPEQGMAQGELPLEGGASGTRVGPQQPSLNADFAVERQGELFATAPGNLGPLQTPEGGVEAMSPRFDSSQITTPERTAEPEGLPLFDNIDQQQQLPMFGGQNFAMPPLLNPEAQDFNTQLDEYTAIVQRGEIAPPELVDSIAQQYVAAVQGATDPSLGLDEQRTSQLQEFIGNEGDTLGQYTAQAAPVAAPVEPVAPGKQKLARKKGATAPKAKKLKVEPVVEPEPEPPTPPTPPKGRTLRAGEKPKPTAVARTQPAGRGGQGLKRGAGGTTGQATGAPVAAATQPEAQPAQPEPVQQPKAEAVRKAVGPSTTAVERSDMSDSERLAAATEVAETYTKVDDAYEDAIYDVVSVGYFDKITSGEAKARKALTDKARSFIENTTFTAKQRATISKVFTAQIRDAKTEGLSAVSGTDVAPWLQFMLDAGRLEDTRPLRGKVKGISKIADPAIREQVAAVLEAKQAPAAVVAPTAVPKAVDPASPLAMLQRFLESYLGVARNVAIWDEPFTFEGTTYDYGPRGFAEDMFTEIDPSDTKATYRGAPIQDYFDRGSLRLIEQSRIPVAGGEFITAKIGTPKDAGRSVFLAPEVGTKLLKGKRDERAAPVEIVDTRTLKDSDTGKFSLSAFNNPETSMSQGAIKLAVNKFLSKLATKPSVRVYRNQADFMQRNPALYRKALAARPEGDFDTAQAAGYSFAGGNVIIFSDRIANEQHLNFVLAHETIGHFGLRGIIPNAKFNATMAQVYQSSPHVQADVDAYMAQGMSKEEAVEEYLSDFAGVLDTSIAARIWNAIKTALNKLGVKFGDEMVRHLLKHSRSYVRQGKPYIHQTDQVFTDMYMVENGYGPAGTGRFSTAGDLHGAQQTIVDSRFAGWQAPSDMAGAWRRFVDEVGPTANKLDRFVGQFLSLQVFRGRKNPGAQRLYDILQMTNGIATRVRVRSNERNRAIFNSAKKVQEQVSGLVYAAQSLAESRITDVRKLNGPPLFFVENGVLTPNKDEIDRLKAAGRIEFKQARDGFEYPVTLIDGSTRMEKFAGIPDLKEDSIEWKGYESLRESMDDAAIDLLRARYSATLADRNVSFRQFDELVEGKLTDAEKKFLDDLLTTYRNLYAEGTKQDEEGNTVFDRAAMQRADDFLVAVNRSVLNLKEGYDAIGAQFKDQVPDDTVAKLRELSKRIKLGEDKFVVQTRMKQLMIDSLSTKDADLYTRRSLAIGYTPLLREGAYQLRIQAINPRTGQPVKLDEASRNKLVYMQMESESQVVRLADELNTLLSADGKPKRYTLKAYNADTQTVEDTEVVLRASAERALDAVTGPPGFNLNEIQYGLRQLNINLTPTEVENVVVAMTRQNAAARNRLQRSNVPGAERDAIKAISKHIDSRASTIAKTEMRPYLNELMNLSMRSSQELWNGNKAELDRLKKQAETSGTTTDRRNYNRYKYMFETTNPKGGAERGNEFYNEASRTVQFLNESRDVSTSNFESGATAARLRSFASAVQLGGSIATAVMNFIGVYTNGIPFLATYNDRNGFGGGFGAGAAISEYHRALGQVGAPGVTDTKLNTAEFYADMSEADLKKYGLTRNEAKFIAAEIREGRMIPAQSNALLNTSRGYADSPFLRRFTEVWMAPFNTSEQAARRSLGLAAFRLEFARQKLDKKTDQEAYDAASRFAAETLDVTMGEYGVLNRPPAWRGGIQTILYMYKVYPTTAIQLLANMDRKGQIAMLFMLLLFSGLQGLPFAEDLEDIVDTIAQALGLTMGSIRAEGTKMLESALPGASVPLMQGVMNMVLPVDIGAKLSLGGQIPGTGILLAGADVTRELQDIAGPMPAAIIQSGKTVYNALRLPFSDQVRLPDVLRETPVTMLRALGDTMAYAESGMVVDKRGYTVTGEATIGTFAARLTGFQPPETAQQYAAIRVANRITDYRRDTVTMYRTAWVRAKMAGDNDAARDIEKAVAKWNEGAAGTGLRINNFSQGNQRALREAKRPAGERALRTTPMDNREDIAAIYDMMGAT